MASKKLKQALMAGLAGAALAGSAKMKGEALKKGIGSDAVASGIKEKTGILF
jgi:F0F1-type ATP synthase membrane subunit c/vacuolar-type H+-ATPase subunit K